MMVDCKLWYATFLVIVVVTVCHAECSEGDISPSTSIAAVPSNVEDKASEVVYHLEQTSTTPQDAVKVDQGASRGSSSCEKAEQDVAKTEEIIVEKSGKKYKVITVTIPIDSSRSSLVEQSTERDKRNSEIDADTEVKPESDTNRASTDANENENSNPSEVQTKPDSKEKNNREKVKAEKKKSKREVGKRDKKSKRKAEEGKRYKK